MLNEKYLFFDLDGTLTESRAEMSFEMLETLKELCKTKFIIVISGAEHARMVKQLRGFIPNYTMAQSGGDSGLWKNTLSHKDKKDILTHMGLISDLPNYDMIDDRGCQMSLSFTGHNANLKLKKEFDPTGELRTELLKKYPFVSDTLECRVAGTTCLDYTNKNSTKGKNIERLLARLDWDKNNCVYFGDKLMKGGNDESVIGIIKTVAVSGPQELLEILKKYEDR